MDIRFRSAQLSDAEAIRRLILAASVPTLQDFSETGRTYYQQQLACEQLANKLALVGDFGFYLAEDSEQLLAVMAMKANNHIYYWFVAPEWQLQGIGRRLWQYVQQQPLFNLEQPVSVNASLASIPAYQKLGFQCIGTEQEFKGMVFQPMLLSVHRS